MILSPDGGHLDSAHEGRAACMLPERQNTGQKKLHYHLNYQPTVVSLSHCSHQRHFTGKQAALIKQLFIAQLQMGEVTPSY